MLKRSIEIIFALSLAIFSFVEVPDAIARYVSWIAMIVAFTPAQSVVSMFRIERVYVLIILGSVFSIALMFDGHLN